MEASAVHFNSGHGMDWNKWIREGIPYVHRETEEKLREALVPKEPEKKNDPSRGRMALTKESDMQTTTNAIASLKAWLADEAKKDETEFEVIETNAYLRRFMHEAFASDFPDLIIESRPTAARGISKMFALRLTEELKQERAKKVQTEKEAELTKKVGVRKVFDAMAKAKKPVIGHAVLMDMLFAMSHFEAPLPPTYEEFKDLLKSLFPVIMDTQFLAKSETFKYVPRDELVDNADPKAKRENRFGSMALGAVFKVFELEQTAAKKAGKPYIDIKLAEGHERYGPGCTSFHEAAYDAYVTGYAFAHMAKEALDAEHMSSLNGRTTMWKSLYHANLLGEDELIAKGIYVHVAGLKGKDEKYAKKAFADVKAAVHDNGENKQNGEVKEDIIIRWVDDDSAFAVLPEACCSAVSAMLEKAKCADGENGGLKFTSWNDWLSAQVAPEEAEDEPPRKRAKISA